MNLIGFLIFRAAPLPLPVETVFQSRKFRTFMRQCTNFIFPQNTKTCFLSATFECSLFSPYCDKGPRDSTVGKLELQFEVMSFHNEKYSVKN